MGATVWLFSGNGSKSIPGICELQTDIITGICKLWVSTDHVKWDSNQSGNITTKGEHCINSMPGYHSTYQSTYCRAYIAFYGVL